VLAGSLFLVCVCAASASFAAVDQVTSLADNGLPGTLRTQIAAAVPGDTIVFSVRGTITLKLGPLEIQKNVIISGPGETKIFIDGAGLFNVFQVDSGVAAVISGVTIENGYASRAIGGGGVNNQGALALISTTVSNNIQNEDGANGEGIYNGGILTLLSSSVSDDISSNDGAGVYNAGTLEIIGSTVSNNGGGLPGASGGGIYNASGGKLTVVSSTISDNGVHDGGQGAGIYNDGSLNVLTSTISDNDDFSGSGAGIYNSGSLSVLSTTFSGNSSIGDFGGAIYNDGVATVLKSTLTGNSATEGNWGGAIFNDGTLTIINSTLSANTTDSGRGGAIYNFSGTVVMSFSTVSANSADDGGAIYNEGTLTLKSTLLAGQSSGGNCFEAGTGSASSDGYNLSDDSTCTFLTQTGDQNNSTTAGLSPSGLQNNGGPTQTIALLSTSSALNAIPVGACTDTIGNKINTDQRGVKRPQGSGCDIGAFELAMKK
jgi:predicted outer membrane repeat protein